MYTIYHPFNGVLNSDCKRGLYEYVIVHNVDAVSLEDAFRKSQNDFDDVYRSLNLRSTSVGDIICDDTTNKYYMVNGIGFTEVPFTVVSYIDWGNHPVFIEHLAQQMLDNPEDYGLV